MTPIRFGTDGWRAVIAEGFTFPNVDRVAQATADYGRTIPSPAPSPRPLSGYDRRFLSDQFARRTAEVLAGNGFKVTLTHEPTPTPAVSLAVKAQRAIGGVMITASHNPPIFNGFKIKAHFGGSADPAICQGVEAELDRSPVQAMPFADAVKARQIVVRPAAAALRRGEAPGGFQPDRQLPPALCSRRPFRRRGGMLRRAAGRHNLQGHDPQRPPRLPVRRHQSRTYRQELRRRRGLLRDILTTSASSPTATPTGWRHGRPRQSAFDPSDHLPAPAPFILNRKGKGRIVKALTTTSMVDKICAKYGLPLLETGVGFKYICAEMAKGGVLLGFEESGGIGFPGHIPERDGILAGLVLLELLAVERQSVNRLLAKLEAEFGPHRYARIDAHFPLEKRPILMDYLKNNPPAKLLRSPVCDVKSYDGVKFVAEDSSWLMLRGSGTEPILRIYAEAKSDADALRLVRSGARIARQLAK